ncbi:hypothetical protein [Rhodococcoides yunnanense]|uniref:hypothetical protein n=1 Tax=Rhodococcoides yunnanense TaxID=278209 RepID=UPI0009327AB5|nr:hypothetical protein [Rhodococcus yunnanensis]
MTTGTRADVAATWQVPRRWFTPRRVVLVAAVAVVAQLTVRAFVLASGNFYWDDLILIGRGSVYPLFSGDLLLYDHDGHFMPAAFFVAALTTKIAPLHWFLPALTILVMQAAASLAVLRVLFKILGRTPMVLLPLAFYLFCPLTVPSFAWWAAALNSLPLQFGLAWVAGDAIESARTGRRRYAVTGAIVTAASLLFFEKSVLVPFFAFGVLLVMFGVRHAWNRAAPLWISCISIVAVWGIVFAVVGQGRFAFHGWRTSIELVHHGLSFGLLPTLLGGPWTWERWPPSGPWASPPTVLVLAAWTALAGVVIVSIRRRRGGAVWVGVLGYVAASSVVMVLARSGPDTADELAQTLRHVADSAVVITVGWALVLRRRTGNYPVWAAAVVLFVVSSVISTVAFVDKWRDDPAPAFLAQARQSLADGQGAALLDQPISSWILTPIAYPNNSIAQIFAAVPERPQFAESTPDLRYLDESGHLVPAVVAPVRGIEQGPESGCGYRVERRTRIPLDGPLADWAWTVQLNYFATADGDIRLELDTGDSVPVPVTEGLHTVYVRLVGSGAAVTVTPETPGMTVCVGAGPVGTVMLADLN